MINFGEDLIDQISLMTKALRAEGGVGLAANQLGFDNSVLIVECPYKDRGLIPLTIFINPEIVEYSNETDLMDEGCLSLPPIELETERSLKLKVKYRDELGKWHKIAPKNFLARILQHETDHLNGILFTDRVRKKFLTDFPELKDLKIVYIGSGDFAEIILKGLIVLGLNIPLVITEQGKPAGRNKKVKPTKVFELAKLFEIDTIETTDIKTNIRDIADVNPDLIILSDFGQIIPAEILDMPDLGALNLHPSLLPKYRGATPIQSAILAGEETTGVSLIKMVPKIDEGPILAQIKADILEDDNAQELEKRLAVSAVKLLFLALPRLVRDELKPFDQGRDDKTKTHKFKKEEGLIDWAKSPQETDRQIRAFFPWPGTYTVIDNKRLIIQKAHLDDGKLVLDLVQPEGKSPMPFTDFLRGFKGKKPS